jgi:hypothetical protein
MMQRAFTTGVHSVNDDRCEAIAWLVNRLRWERTLDRLRSEEAGRVDEAA